MTVARDFALAEMALRPDEPLIVIMDNGDKAAMFDIKIGARPILIEREADPLDPNDTIKPGEIETYTVADVPVASLDSTELALLSLLGREPATE
ncbi:MAG: hypothetical protein AAFX52_11185 [Pseudomonadota bacterium]